MDLVLVVAGLLAPIVFLLAYIVVATIVQAGLDLIRFLTRFIRGRESPLPEPHDVVPLSPCERWATLQ